MLPFYWWVTHLRFSIYHNLFRQKSQVNESTNGVFVILHPALQFRCQYWCCLCGSNRVNVDSFAMIGHWCIHSGNRPPLNLACCLWDLLVPSYWWVESHFRNLAIAFLAPDFRLWWQKLFERNRKRLQIKRNSIRAHHFGRNGYRKPILNSVSFYLGGWFANWLRISPSTWSANFGHIS